ncbi:OTU domain-containing protein 6B [Symbiodinium microadriaticum]|uniref:OTU domain-containing protein 6B n=1 Tax=Symbiodinium microadriaticum TaxID=2951 RepID=A0A1Q9CRA5_SYMMI|nr:OTU domain-containing protein 6B [Symbiodinium microadriaticum]
MVGTFVLIQLGVFLILDWFFLGKVIMAGACDMPCWVNCSAIGFPSLHTTASSIWTSGLRGLPTWGLLGLLEMICLATLVGGWFLGFCTHVLCPTMPAGHGDFMPALSCDWCSVPLPGMNLSLFCAVRLCVYTLWGVGYTGSRNAFSFRMTPAAWTSHWPCRLSFALSWLLGAVVGLAWPAPFTPALPCRLRALPLRDKRFLFGCAASSGVFAPRVVRWLRSRFGRVCQDVKGPWTSHPLRGCLSCAPAWLVVVAVHALWFVSYPDLGFGVVVTCSEDLVVSDSLTPALPFRPRPVPLGDDGVPFLSISMLCTFVLWTFCGVCTCKRSACQPLQRVWASCSWSCFLFFFLVWPLATVGLALLACRLYPHFGVRFLPALWTGSVYALAFRDCGSNKVCKRVCETWASIKQQSMYRGGLQELLTKIGADRSASQVTPSQQLSKKEKTVTCHSLTAFVAWLPLPNKGLSESGIRTDVGSRRTVLVKKLAKEKVAGWKLSQSDWPDKVVLTCGADEFAQVIEEKVADRKFVALAHTKEEAQEIIHQCESDDKLKVLLLVPGNAESQPELVLSGAAAADTRFSCSQYPGRHNGRVATGTCWAYRLHAEAPALKFSVVVKGEAHPTVGALVKKPPGVLKDDKKATTVALRFQLGKRYVSADTWKQCLAKAGEQWRVELPSGWEYEDVEELVKASGFQEVSLVAKVPRRRGVAWVFRAVPEKSHATAESVQLSFDVDAPPITIVKETPRKPVNYRVKQLLGDSVISFKPGKKKPESAKHADAARDARTDAMDVEAEDLEQKANDDTARDAGKDKSQSGVVAGLSPPPKRSKGNGLPLEAKVVPNSGDGNCLFESIAQGMSSAEGKRCTKGQIRIACCSHLERHLDDYEPFWDHKNPNGTKSEGNFKGYIDNLKKVGSWGGYLEINAISSTLGIKVLVWHKPSDLVHRFNSEASGPTICLLYDREDKHYEWVDGPVQDEFIDKAVDVCISKVEDYRGLSDISASVARYMHLPKLHRRSKAWALTWGEVQQLDAAVKPGALKKQHYNEEDERWDSSRCLDYALADCRMPYFDCSCDVTRWSDHKAFRFNLQGARVEADSWCLVPAVQHFALRDVELRAWRRALAAAWKEVEVPAVSNTEDEWEVRRQLSADRGQLANEAVSFNDARPIAVESVWMRLVAGAIYERDAIQLWICAWRIDVQFAGHDGHKAVDVTLSIVWLVSEFACFAEQAMKVDPGPWLAN